MNTKRGINEWKKRYKKWNKASRTIKSFLNLIIPNLKLYLKTSYIPSTFSSFIDIQHPSNNQIIVHKIHSSFFPKTTRDVNAPSGDILLAACHVKIITDEKRSAVNFVSLIALAAKSKNIQHSSSLLPHISLSLTGKEIFIKLNSLIDHYVLRFETSIPWLVGCQLSLWYTR